MLFEGTLSLATGIKTLNSGSLEMKNGLTTLNDGTSNLANANNQLTEGASTLSEGATTLSYGISKFNKEGINTICNYINGNLKHVSIKLEKLQELANDYNNFTMLNNGTEGNVKFIMIMDGIKNDITHKEDAILNDDEKSSFFI